MIRRVSGTVAVLVAVAATLGPAVARPEGAVVPVATRCARAASLATAGETAAAKAIYVALASTEDAPCATAALTALDGKTAGDVLIADVTRALTMIGSAAAALLLAVLAVVLAYVVLSWTPVRAILARMFLVGRLFDPTLKVDPFTDAGAKPQVGSGVTGIVRGALSRLGAEQDETSQLAIDSTAGIEAITNVIGGLGELAPQAKGVAGMITALPALARTPRYSVEGTLQLAGASGDGLTVTLKERGDLAATTTLWWPAPATDANPDAYYLLASAAAGWADFTIRDREKLERPDLTTDAQSFGYFHAGVELDRVGRRNDAHDAYVEALRHDEENCGALLNLGLIYAREDKYDLALVLFLRALAIAGRTDDSGAGRLP